MYATPKLAVYGDAAEQIRGGCGWGTEGLALNKTGYYKYYYTKCYWATAWSCRLWSECTTSQPSDDCSYAWECEGPEPYRAG